MSSFVFVFIRGEGRKGRNRGEAGGRFRDEMTRVKMR
jgi:hypothetical protein